MKNESTPSFWTQVCAKGPPVAVAVGIGAALSVSNGPAVGIAIGAALGLVFWRMRRR